MERYSEYKDSGVKWLGEIPSHWEMQRWRFLMTENCRKNTDCKIHLQLQFKYGDIVQKANQSDETDVLETISKYTIVEPNDIMINGLNLNYDFISQRVAQVQEEGVITSAYISLRPTDIANSRYYTYFLKSMDSKKMFHGMGTGIRLTLSYNELKNQFIPYPPLKEQELIANFLDTATSKIDAAIAQQQKMIDLLNERKQIIINNAVTKGLDPNVKMKPSGIDWIGDIPENWRIMKLKHFVEVTDGTHDTPIYVEPSKRTYPMVTSRCIENGEIRLELANHISEYDYKIISCRSYVSKYDVIMPMIGTIGNPAIVLTSEKFAIKNVALFRTNGNYTKAKLLANLLNSKIVSEQISVLNKGGVQNFVSQEIIKNLIIVIPNRIETIVSYLDEVNSLIDNTKNEIIQKISLLQERKHIIINDVVTGKVKVV